MNEEKFQELHLEAENTVADMIQEFPDVSEDDVAHDTIAGICAMNYNEWPEEVDELWRTTFGETWTHREAAIARLREELR